MTIDSDDEKRSQKHNGKPRNEEEEHRIDPDALTESHVPDVMSVLDDNPDFLVYRRPRMGPINLLRLR